MTNGNPSPDPSSTPRRRVPTEAEMEPYGWAGLAAVIVAVLLGVHWLAAWFVGIAVTGWLAHRSLR